MVLDLTDLEKIDKVVRVSLKDILAPLLGDESAGKLAKKWQGGKLVMWPREEGLAGHELPIETFFHKIVMVRDRLRTLEQQINAHETLTEQDKVHLQGYITRCYGSLTTFNALFRDKEDHFKSGPSRDK
jgi:hypothetical protein